MFCLWEESKHKCLCFKGMHVPEGSLYSTSMTVWNLPSQRVFNEDGLGIMFLRPRTHLAAAGKENYEKHTRRIFPCSLGNGDLVAVANGCGGLSTGPGSGLRPRPSNTCWKNQLCPRFRLVSTGRTR